MPSRRRWRNFQFQFDGLISLRQPSHADPHEDEPEQETQITGNSDEKPYAALGFLEKSAFEADELSAAGHENVRVLGFA